MTNLKTKKSLLLKHGLVLFLITIAFLTNAQDTINYKDVRKHNICLEVGGISILYSLNYERNLFIKQKIYQSLKVGIGGAYLPEVVNGVNQILIPIDYNFYLGKGRLKLILGAGVIGLIGTNPSPGSFSARQDYLKLYNSNQQYVAVSKYGTNHFEKAFDLAYTAKLGFKYIGKRIDFYAYYNCFYIRFSTAYYFKPDWFGMGLSLKIGR